MKTLILLSVHLISVAALAQDLLPYQLQSRNSKHPRAIAATCVHVNNAGKCDSFQFYYVDDAGKSTLITKTAFSTANLEELKTQGFFRNAWNNSQQTSLISSIHFVRDAGGSYGDSKFADVMKGATRGVGYVIAVPIGLAGDATGDVPGTMVRVIRKLFRNPKLDKLIETFDNGQSGKIDVAKIDALREIIYCSGEEAVEPHASGSYGGCETENNALHNAEATVDVD